MKILITGIYGLIGTNLALELSKEHVVYGLDCNSESPNKKYLEKIWVKESRMSALYAYDFDWIPDIIVNLACPAAPNAYHDDPLFCLETCSKDTIELFKYALNRECYVIHASSSEIYGDVAMPISEKVMNGYVNPIGPRAMYAEGKRFAEAALEEFKTRGLQACTLRIFNTYGPYFNINDGRVISEFFRVATKEDPKLYPVQGGYQTRSFMYVEDLVRAIKYVIHNRPTEIYNVGNPHQEVTINKLSEIFILKYYGEKQKSSPKEEEIKRRVPDITKIYNDLGWEPYINLSTGIERTYEWLISTK